MADTEEPVVADEGAVAPTKEEFYEPAPEATHEPGTVDDLSTLNKLTDVILVNELEVRYDKDVIYTWVGDILIAVNPFKHLPIYGSEQMKKYVRVPRSTINPHIYAISDACYHNMLDTKASQCAVISGESGAGKTESAKHVINHIIDLCSGDIEGKDLERQIIEISPLLEAFGNAQTVMNDNSSRFGKYTRLLFDDQGVVLGVQLSEYLLEKSRVVEQAPGERNFHVFYYIFDSPNAEKYHLTSPSDFGCLGGKPWEDNATMYKELIDAMNTVGFAAESQETIHEILAACIHLANIHFEGEEEATSKDKDAIAYAAELLKVPTDKLLESMIGANTVTRGEHIRRTFKPHEAYDCRDALSKALYGSLFGWIVNSINRMLAPALHSGEDDGKTRPEIGVLDIFGFENFKENSFEQICINLAHEQLQNFFNKHTFTLELEEYEREGIDGSSISFKDNEPLIQMFLTKPIGILSLLDEECTMPSATDDTFVGKLNKHLGEYEHYSIVKMNRGYPAFAVKHFPGTVEYCARNFLEKNKDNLASDIVDLMQDSGVAIVQDLFTGEILSTGQIRPRQHFAGDDKLVNKVSRKTPTLSAQFKNSLAVLIGRMNECYPHFVRCMKPNLMQQGDNFQTDFVKTQLLYQGVLEVTRIRSEGYAWRPEFNDFVQRYKIVAFNLIGIDEVEGTPENAAKILKHENLKDWQTGKSKLFLKYHYFDHLEQKIDQFYKDVLRAQCAVRAFFARKIYKEKLRRLQLNAAERAALEAKEAEEERIRELAAIEKAKQDAIIKAAEKAAAEAEAEKAKQIRLQKEEERRMMEEEARKAEEEMAAMTKLNAKETEMERAKQADVQAEAARKAREEALRATELARLEAEKRESELAELARAAEETREAKLRAEEEAKQTKIARQRSRKIRKKEVEEQVQAAQTKAEEETKAALDALAAKEAAERAHREAEQRRIEEEKKAMEQKEAALRDRLRQMEEAAKKAKEQAEAQAKASAEAQRAKEEAEKHKQEAEELRRLEEQAIQAEKEAEEAEAAAADWRRPDFDLAKRVAQLTEGKFSSPDIHIDPRSAKGFLAKIKATNMHSTLGFLRNRGRKNWKRRWFVFDLDDKTIRYYESDNCKKLKNTIPVSSIVRVFSPNAGSARHQNMFMIEASDQTYFCEASTPEAMHLWIATLNVVSTGAGVRRGTVGSRYSGMSTGSRLSMLSSRSGSAASQLSRQSLGSKQGSAASVSTSPLKKAETKNVGDAAEDIDA